MRESRAVPNEEQPVRGRLLSIAEAVEKTCYGKDWFYNHMENGTLPFPWFLLGPGKRCVDSADIDDWLKIRKIQAGKMPGDRQGGFV